MKLKRLLSGETFIKFLDSRTAEEDSNANFLKEGTTDNHFEYSGHFQDMKKYWNAKSLTTLL